MSALSSKITQALATVLTATMLTTACNDSTAPSVDEGPGGSSSAQPPADTSRAAAPQGIPNHQPTDPPNFASADSATSPFKQSFYTKSTTYGSGYAPGPGAMNVFPRSVTCLGGFISLTQGGVTVSRTTSGLSSTYNQHVVGEVFLYRLVGGKWVYQSWKRADAPLPWVAPVAHVKQSDFLLASVPGAYRVILRLTWYAWIGGVWVRTAGTNVNFVHGSDYQAVVGSTVSAGGYCRVS
jgi:hypothetical protein